MEKIVAKVASIGKRATQDQKRPRDVREGFDECPSETDQHCDRERIIELFDAANLVRLHCGTLKLVEGKIIFFLQNSEVEKYGVAQCRQVFKGGIEPDPHPVLRNQLCHGYGIPLYEFLNESCDEKNMERAQLDDKDANLFRDGVSLLEIRTEESTGLDSHFVMQFCWSILSSFYWSNNVYSITKPPSCSLLDIVLSKGGPEAIAENFYGAMLSQQQSGDQSNETLVRRTKVGWYLPSLKLSDDLIKDAVALYREDDENIRAYRLNKFFSSKAVQCV